MLRVGWLTCFKHVAAADCQTMLRHAVLPVGVGGGACAVQVSAVPLACSSASTHTLLLNGRPPKFKVELTTLKPLHVQRVGCPPKFHPRPACAGNRRWVWRVWPGGGSAWRRAGALLFFGVLGQQPCEQTKH
jgi:hypothetical protein